MDHIFFLLCGPMRADMQPCPHWTPWHSSEAIWMKPQTSGCQRTWPFWRRWDNRWIIWKKLEPLMKFLRQMPSWQFASLTWNLPRLHRKSHYLQGSGKLKRYDRLPRACLQITLYLGGQVWLLFKEFLLIRLEANGLLRGGSEMARNTETAQHKMTLSFLYL